MRIVRFNLSWHSFRSNIPNLRFFLSSSPHCTWCATLWFRREHALTSLQREKNFFNETNILRTFFRTFYVCLLFQIYRAHLLYGDSVEDLVKMKKISLILRNYILFNNEHNN